MTIQTLNKLFSQGSSSFYKAGQLVVMMRNEHSLAEISRKSEILTIANLKQLIDIYEGRLLPELLFKTPARNYVKKLPIETQREILRNGVEVVRPVGNKLVKKYVAFSALKLRDCRIVFNGGTVRTVNAQRKLIKRGLTARPSYKIENGRVFVLRQTSFSTKELNKLLTEIV